jgi:hypothetical protein
MAFTGDLDTFDLFDLLSWLLGRRKSGTLVLTRRSTRKRFAFREATLMSSSSNDPRETIGQALVRERFISEEALFTALVRQESDRRRLGAILIGEGLLSEEQLLRTLRANAEAQIADAFLWPEGRFDFRDDEVPPPEAGELGIELRPVLDEGRHRREQWQLLRQRFPSSEVTFRVTGALERVVDPTQKQILAVALAGKTLAAISLEARRSEYDTALLLAQLCDEGLLTVDRIEAGSAEADPVGTIIALLAAAEMRLKEGRFEAALEAYERVLAIDGVNQAAKKGLVALTEARRKAKAARKVPLDKVPVLRLTAMSLTQQKFDPQEGFVLSRINGQWDVRSILKLCPIPEDDALLIFARLLDRQVIELR